MKTFLIRLPENWIEKLKEIARQEAAKRNQEVTVTSLIREALGKKYGLKSDE